MKGLQFFVPSAATHGSKNTGGDTLSYSTANQAFGRHKEEEIGIENHCLTIKCL